MRIWNPSTPKKLQQSWPPKQPKQQQAKSNQNRLKVSSPAEKFVVVSKQESNGNTQQYGPNRHNKNPSDDSTAGSSICSTESDNTPTVVNRTDVGVAMAVAAVERNPAPSETNSTATDVVVTSSILCALETFDTCNIANSHLRSGVKNASIKRTAAPSLQDQRTHVLETSKKLLQTRGFSIRKQLMTILQEESARLLQARIRGHLARIAYQEQVVRYRETARQASATRLQAQFRGHLARTNYQEQLATARFLHFSGEQEASATLLQAQFRGYLARTHYQEQVAAAKFIQFYYRESKIRRAHIQQLLDYHLQDYLEYQQNCRLGATIMMQALVRGGLVRLRLRSRKEKNQEKPHRKPSGLMDSKSLNLQQQHYKSQEPCVIPIQAAWRGRHTRKRLKAEYQNKIAADEAEYQKIAAAARNRLLKAEYQSANAVASPRPPMPEDKRSNRRRQRKSSPSPLQVGKAVDEEELNVTPLHSNKFLETQDGKESILSDSDTDDSSDGDWDSEEEDNFHRLKEEGLDEAQVHEMDSDEDDEFDHDNDDVSELEEDDGTFDGTYDGTYDEDVPIEVLQKLEKEEAKNRQGGWFNELLMDIVGDFEDTWQEMTITKPQSMDA